jgi:hypothetical protein
MVHADERPERTTMLRFGSLDFVFDGPVESPAGAVFSRSQPDAPAPPQDQPHEEPQVVKSATDRVWDLVGRNMAVALGPNPSQELFRFAAFATSMLVFGLQEEETLTWDEFKLCYDSVYPEGQARLPCGGVNTLAATGGARPVPSGASQSSCDEAESAPLGKKAPTPHNSRWERFILQQRPDAVHSTNSEDSSTEGEPTSPDASASKEPRKTSTTTSGSGRALTSLTRLRRLSRTSRRGSTTRARCRGRGNTRA